MKKNMIFILLCLYAAVPQAVARPGSISEQDIFSPVQAENGMLVTGEFLAAEAGLKVLQAGGNAVDAAVTAGFVMAVTLPNAGNIGGGGFMLIHSADGGAAVKSLCKRVGSANQAGKGRYKPKHFTRDAARL